MSIRSQVIAINNAAVAAQDALTGDMISAQLVRIEIDAIWDALTLIAERIDSTTPTED